MFKIIPNPTLQAAVAISRPGEVQPGLINFNFKHLGNREAKAWITRLSRIGDEGEGAPESEAVWLHEVISSWESPIGEDDKPLAYSLAALDQLCNSFPLAASEIYAAYLKARLERPAGN